MSVKPQPKADLHGLDRQGVRIFLLWFFHQLFWRRTLLIISGENSDKFRVNKSNEEKLFSYIFLFLVVFGFIARFKDMLIILSSSVR